MTGWAMQSLAMQPDTISINQDLNLTDFDQRLVFGVDPDKSKTIQAIQDSDSFFSAKYNREYLQGGNIWAKVVINHQSELPTDYILEVKGYKEVIVYVRVAGEEEYQTKRTGRYVPFPENELKKYNSRRNKVELNLKGQTTYELLIFYADPGIDKIQIGLKIAQKNRWQFFYSEIDKNKNLLLGVFFGITIILAFINLFYYFFLRELTYLAYFIYLLTLVMFEGSRYSLLDAILLSRIPVGSLIAENCVLLLSVIAYLVFLKKFISLESRFPGWNKIINAMIYILAMGIPLVVLVMGVLEYPRTAIELRNYTILITLPFIISFLFSIAKTGDKIDRVFVIGSFVLLLTGLTSILLDLFHPATLYPDIIFQTGTIIEILIFAIALSMKSRDGEIQQKETQLKLIDQLKENERLQLSINKELEVKVNERTKEIQAQNEELMTQQEELAGHRDMLESQNKIISESMEEMQLIRMQLEELVEQRTLELKNTNSELLQRNDQLEQYAYITAHNLRGPVARLKGLVHIFDKTVGVSSENKEVVQRIVNSVLEMDEVLTDMNAILELKNQHYGKTVQVDIKIVLEKVKKILQDNIHESNARINEKLECRYIFGNAPYIESIFYNLLSNAIKYREESRELIIDIVAFSNESDIVLQITDNGVGIDLDRFGSKIFGLYQRFHDHVAGKGLGLYLVKTQVEAMDGKITVDSMPGQGTTFTIVFPASVSQ